MSYPILFCVCRVRGSGVCGGFCGFRINRPRVGGFRSLGSRGFGGFRAGGLAG